MTYETWKQMVDKIYAKVEAPKFRVVAYLDKPASVGASDMITLNYIARKAFSEANVVSSQAIDPKSNLGANWKVVFETTEKFSKAFVRTTLMAIYWDGKRVDVTDERIIAQK